MKKIVFLTIAAFYGLWATDFSSMSTEELMALRGSVSEDERDAYRTEVQSRMSSMSAEERASYRGKGSGSGQGKMQRKGR